MSNERKPVNPVKIVEGTFEEIIKCEGCGENMVCVEDATGEKFYTCHDSLVECAFCKKVNAI